MLVLIATSSPVFAQDYSKDVERFLEDVNSNPSLREAYWLEMQNAFGDWEKLMLIFGYADPGDRAACEAVSQATAQRNLGRYYRCNPVT